MDINRATIVGRLTRDPEVRTTPSGVNVTSFGVATNFVWTDATGSRKESVEFHNVVAWRKLGEIAAQYLKKGRRVLIEGRLATSSWQGQDGVKRSRTEIVADNMIMLDGRAAEGPSSAVGGSGQTATAPRAQEPENVIQVEEPAAQQRQPDLSAEAPAKAGAEAEEISVEDIPF